MGISFIENNGHPGADRGYYISPLVRPPYWTVCLGQADKVSVISG